MSYPGFGYCCMECEQDFESPGMLNAHTISTGHLLSITQRVDAQPVEEEVVEKFRHSAPLDDNGEDVDDDD